jgi:hypothetical protein
MQPESSLMTDEPVQIPKSQYDCVRKLDVDEHKTSCDWHRWEAKFEGDKSVGPLVEQCRNFLGKEFSRADLVRLYQSDEFKPEAKFLAAMIWGHEAPAGSRPDRRGPWKVAQMFSDAGVTIKLLRQIEVDTDTQLRAAYKSGLSLKRCGPNFFTKHLYFLGKASRQRHYPLIFDDRVAGGLLKLSGKSSSVLGMVTIHARPKVNAYLDYLAFAYADADRIGCSPDQIEYFLFRL